jgi:hypothetical protein
VTVAGADFAVCQSCLPQPAALRVGDVIADMVPAGAPAMDWQGTLTDRRWWRDRDRRRPVLLIVGLMSAWGALAVTRPALVFVAAPVMAVAGAVWDWRALRGDAHRRSAVERPAVAGRVPARAITAGRGPSC